eukprot:scaffold33820_cov51-Attheya_sp.AAC.5
MEYLALTKVVTQWLQLCKIGCPHVNEEEEEEEEDGYMMLFNISQRTDKNNRIFPIIALTNGTGRIRAFPFNAVNDAQSGPRTRGYVAMFGTHSNCTDCEGFLLCCCCGKGKRSARLLEAEQGSSKTHCDHSPNNKGSNIGYHPLWQVVS